MEGRQSILDATEYILVALNNIKTIEDFFEYKQEIAKAINDIRNIAINLMKMKIDNFNDSNFDNNQENYNKLQTSDLSLKFNYENYLNGNQTQNLYQNDSMFNNYIQNNNQNIEENKANNNINISNKTNFDEINMNDNNNQRSNNFQNNNNLSYNKSIREQYNIYNNRLENNNNNFNQNIMNDYSKQNILNLNGEPRFNSKKDKLNIIADIIMKINSEDYYYEILTKLHGDDLTDKLMSSDVSNEFLESILNSINEIERSKKREEEIEEVPEIFPMENYKNHNRKNKNKNKKFKIKNNSFNEYNYNNNLNLKKTDSREYNEINVKKNGGKKVNSGSRKERPFINATCAYGNYFDPPLQKGGMSKLTSYKKK